MDDNPYASPEISRGFHEELDGPAIVRSTLDKMVLKKETRRIVELTGIGGYLGFLAFAGLMVAGLLFSEEPATLQTERKSFLLLSAIATAIVTHVATIRLFAARRLRKMRAVYDVRPGDDFEIEISPEAVRFRSERAEYEWRLDEVAAAIVGKDEMLTFVAQNLITLPIPAAADFGDLELATFRALYKEQQRRYRETQSPLHRLRYALRGGGWV